MRGKNDLTFRVAAPAPLGALREEFGRSERARRQYAFFAALGFALGLPFGRPGAWLPGSIFLALGVFMVWAFLRRRDVRVRLYERGFTFTRRGRTREFPRDEVEVFSESQQVFGEALTGLESGAAYRYFVRLGDGRSLAVDNEVAGVRGLGERLRAETLKRLLPGAEALVARGGAADFGPLALTREGVSRGGRRLPWAEVGRVDASGANSSSWTARAGGGPKTPTASSPTPTSSSPSRGG